MWRVRRAFARAAWRVIAGQVTADLERVLQAGPCPRCGAWRCPECHWLILSVHDHNWACTRRRLPHAGGA